MIGKMISHYKILEKLGEGGMGVVYKAEDTKLDRLVALKFLPTRSLGSEEDRKRFEQEAKAAAALNHPNIATIYEINEYEGDTFIAMEYVDGVTLTEKIKDGPLKIKNAMNIAKQVADGLNAAHEKGVFHRDIKSSNIMLTKKNQVKILDFGLAKIKAGSMVTKPGTMLGTIACMSPEQARGEEVDHRTDIWSLGVIFYEMISGQLPFKGEYESAMIYSIMNLDPEPLTGLRTGVPMDLEKIINKLLEKDPDDRYQNVIELPVDLKAVDLKSIGTSQISTTILTEKIAQKPALWRRVVPWSITAIMAVVAVWSLIHLYKFEPLPNDRYMIDLPPNAKIETTMDDNNLIALSPDGTRLVYVANLGNTTQLYLREIDKFDVIPIPGTEGANTPFFSPNSKQIGYYEPFASKLMKIALPDGAPIPICYAPSDTRGASWGDDDTIVFGSLNSGLFVVSADGDSAQPLTTLNTKAGERTHRFPQILPGSKAVIFMIGTNDIYTYDESRIAVVSLETHEQKILVERGSSPQYVPTGHIVYSRAGNLMAMQFDSKRIKETGSPFRILEGIVSSDVTGAAQFSFSLNGNGKLVYISGGPEIYYNRIVWVNREGEVTQLTPNLSQPLFQLFNISPDRQKIAVMIAGANNHIWRYDMTRGPWTQLTFKENNLVPVWTPDSEQLTFQSSRGGGGLFSMRADGSGEVELLTTSEYFQMPGSWSPDGNVLVFTELHPQTKNDILTLQVGEDNPSSFLVTEYNEYSPVFSPDGNWIAYMSDEYGKYEVFVRPYPFVPGVKYQISDKGGTEPVWNPKGHELFYQNGEKMMVVAIETMPAFKPESPQLLFTGQFIPNIYLQSYDYDPDGDRFLMIKSEGERTINKINVVVNWFEELKEKFRIEKK